MFAVIVRRCLSFRQRLVCCGLLCLFGSSTSFAATWTGLANLTFTIVSLENLTNPGSVAGLTALGSFDEQPFPVAELTGDGAITANNPSIQQGIPLTLGQQFSVSFLIEAAASDGSVNAAYTAWSSLSFQNSGADGYAIGLALDYTLTGSVLGDAGDVSLFLDWFNNDFSVAGQASALASSVFEPTQVNSGQALYNFSLAGGGSEAFNADVTIAGQIEASPEATQVPLPLWAALLLALTLAGSGTRSGSGPTQTRARVVSGARRRLGASPLGLGLFACVASLAASAVEIPRVPNPQLMSDLTNLPGDLRAVPVPRPSNLSDFIVDERAAIALGKALFWDMQLGSDGIQACASCHFRAGADPRSRHQLSPGLKQVPEADRFLEVGPWNYRLGLDDFPITRLAVPGVRGALDPSLDSNDVVSSLGVHYLAAGADPDGFTDQGLKLRRVEPRNTPSVINAVFNHRQFWDGRADPYFNGVNHLGERDPNAQVVMATNPGQLSHVSVRIDHASLASQAVAPVISDIEMSRPGRDLRDLAKELRRRGRDMGRRLHTARPLAGQIVHPQDSVLGSFSAYPRRGLRQTSYAELVKTAFNSKWWNARQLVRVDAAGQVQFVDRRERGRRVGATEYTLLEYNFALFLGLSIQLYEATLIADDTPWDRFRRQHPGATDPALNPWTNLEPAFITREALFGAHLFNDRTRGPTNIRCSNCHEGAELTDASVSRVDSLGTVRNRDGNIIDRGFNNIGLRPTANDLGVGADDGLGPLSYSKRMFPDVLPPVFGGAAVSKGLGLDGAMRIPSLRNIALTAPYFHNGDVATLEEAVRLYSRGGNVAPVLALDGTPIEPLGVPVLTEAEIDALVAFLESLTDPRVLYRQAPFDHPQLFVPDGHAERRGRLLDRNRDGLADDVMREIPAVGAAGGAPLPGFLEF